MVNRIERASIYWIFMAVAGFFLGTQAIAKDRHALRSLSDEQLSARISEFKEKLEQKGESMRILLSFTRSKGK